ncbi:MAG TPA: universal stress protein [Candidatus Sulfotelmatobacter sp.]|jgi:nucleotide-binding universal stress UspA family protein|nr:universal stress protein [Candidatus Sulfotelmatobacter sp.]
MALIEAKVEEKKSPRTEREESRATALSVKNVLFATDFSATSEAALPYATAVCRHFGSTLHIAHVMSDASILMMTGGVDYVSLSTIYEDAHTEAKEKLEQISGRLEGIRHLTYVRHGQVWENLAGVVQEEGIDLIVLGTHGRSGLGKLLLGSVAENILRHATCPVLTVGPKVSGSAKLPAFQNPRRDLAPVELELKQIVFATNFAENSRCVAQEAVSLAEEFGARLTMLHVIEDYSQLGRRPGPMEDGVRRLHDLIPRNAALQHLPETLLEFGSAWKSILKASGDREADLIVLGAVPLDNLGSTHLPSTAQHVIAQAQCPVLTIRC